MKILGPDYLVFASDDIDACAKCAEDYGLTKVERSNTGAIYHAKDGTGMIIRKPSDTSLAKGVAADPNLRETIYGVADKATLEAIAAELSKDRDVKDVGNGVLRSTDAEGYGISFQVTVRKKLDIPPYGVNVPGQAPGRAINVLGTEQAGDIKPMTMSHLVIFTKDKVKSEKFYAERLGFRTVDSFKELGPFMRPQGTQEHHTLFLIQNPHTLGLQHFTFHFAGINELLKSGWEFVGKGYKSQWGPGRHLLGSNYFWYFYSPFGGIIEMDADMDTHDDSWAPRSVSISKDTTQAYLLQYADKWVPTGGDAH